MSDVNRSIFRPAAMRRYTERANRAVVPYFATSPLFALWRHMWAWIETHLGAWARVLPVFRPKRRVPVLLQLSAAECGAACLAMILSYYGRATSVAECRAVCGIGRDGTTARTITKAAHHFGLRAKAYSLEPADFEHLPLPAIIHWNFDHFVVVEHWSPRWVAIVDPSLGRREVSADEFEAGFTGVALTLEPGVHFERRRLVRPGGRGLWQLLLTRGIPTRLAQLLGASLLLHILGLALPLFTKVLIDYVLPSHVDGVMSILALGIVGLALTQTATSYLRTLLALRLQARLDAQATLGFLEHLLSLPFSFFQQRPSGDLLARLGSNTVIRESLTSDTLSAILDSVFVLIYLTILLTQALPLGLLALALGLVQVGLVIGTARRASNLLQADLAAQGASQGYLVEALSGIATLKAGGAEHRALDHWSNLFFDHLNLALQRDHLSAIVETGLSTLRTFSPLILLWVGALRVLDQQMTLGTMLALNSLSVAFLTPLASLVSSGQRLHLVKAHIDRIADVMETKPEQDVQTVDQAPRLTGRIELQQVSFRYTPDTPLVLRDISLTIEPGQKVALVGRTGSGKSTLGMLLLGLYTPTEGVICYDGRPLQALNYQSLRSQFGVVLQETSLFSGSIRQNIAMSDPDLALSQVVAAAQQAAIHDDIVRMPMGYETRLIEGGSGLSGGQRQRLALARALARPPAILLLDEATSHLDVTTEALVDDNLSQLACTRIVLAHRLSTIRNADLILVLDEGRLVERGRHDELLAQNGYYATLVRRQMSTVGEV